MKRYIISPKNIRTRPPLIGTLVYGMLLKMTNAPEWVWGAVGLLVLFFWIAYFYDLFKHDNEQVDIFNRKSGEPPVKSDINTKSAWQQRLDEVQAKGGGGARP